MTALTFLAEWALRSALVVVAIALGLKLSRVRNPSVRLAAWTAVLIGSLLIPALTSVVPDLSFRVTALPVPEVTESNASSGVTLSGEIERPRASIPWTWFAIGIYLAGTGVLLLRLTTGMVLSSRIVGRSVDTGRRLVSGAAIRESTEMVAPATLGVTSPVVLLPSDWLEWDAAKWAAVLAHEESHIQRRDPLWQFLSAVHRSLLWFTPSSWLLHSQLIRVAEEASDDAALAAAQDRASYAEVLLHFLERAAAPTRWSGVAMARYGKAEQRIHRILESTRIPRGITRIGWGVTVGVAAPVVLLAAAVHAEMPLVQSSSASASTSASQSARGSRNQLRNNRYLIVTGNSMSGSFSSDDRLPLEKWKSKYGPNFVWFRQDGTDYLVTDASVLSELNDAMAPQREVNRMQSEVNQQQSEVNRHQGTVNEHQGRVNKAQGEVNRMQQEVNRGASGGQDRMNAAQSDVNAQQQEVNGEQAVVNGEQSLVNKEQDKVNAEQRRIGPGVEAAIHTVLDSAVLKGLAHGIQR